MALWNLKEVVWTKKDLNKFQWLSRRIDDSVCQVYMDDLLLLRKTEAEHMGHPKRYFEKVRQFVLKLSVEKLLFVQEQIIILGHTYHLKILGSHASREIVIFSFGICSKNEILILRLSRLWVNFFRPFVFYLPLIQNSIS